MRISDWSSDVCSSDLTATTRGTAGCCSLTCRLSWRTRPARLSTPAPSGPSPTPRGRLLREAAGLQQRSGVDADLLAGDVAGLVAGQEDGQVRNVLGLDVGDGHRSEEHTSELQSLMRISYTVFCLKKKTKIKL